MPDTAQRLSAFMDSKRPFMLADRTMSPKTIVWFAAKDLNDSAAPFQHHGPLAECIVHFLQWLATRESWHDFKIGIGHNKLQALHHVDL